MSSYCSGVKTLGSADDNEDNTASWVVKMKKLAEEKKKAEKKVSLLPSLSFSLLYSCVPNSRKIGGN